MIDQINQNNVTFAVDIDDTLYDFSTLARNKMLEFAHERKYEQFLRGAYHPWDEWRSPKDAVGTDAWSEVVEACHEPHIIVSQTPYNGAVDTLRAVYNNGYKILYISNRDPSTEEATDSWLRKCGFPMNGNTELLCLTDNKAKHISDCQYLIDDRPKTMLDFVYSGLNKQAISLMYPYNRSLTDIPNIFLCPTWSGIKNWMERKGIISENNNV